MHLLYGTPSTKENIKKLEQIQKRAARFITSEYSQMTRVTPIVKSLNKNLLQCSDRHRDKNTFFVPYARTNAYKYSFFLSGIREWNGLPEQARKTNNLTSFKTLVGMQD